MGVFFLLTKNKISDTISLVTYLVIRGVFVKNNLIVAVIVIMFMTGCARNDMTYPSANLTVRHTQDNRIIDYEYEFFAHSENELQDYESIKNEMIKLFAADSPSSWGENIDRVITEIDTDEKVIALTFDACDGSPDSFDQTLIQYLIAEEVPATLFIGGQWIEENEAEFMNLANNPLFEIANHGYKHKPLSVTGESAYNISGTASIVEAFDEVYQNQLLIKELTGEFPKYFRSGTAYYDDVAVEMVEKLGLKAVNYNVLGDAGGTFSQTQIINTFQTVNPGSIFLFHMNKPNSAIASGVKEGISHLKEAGYTFVQLQEYDDLLK